jgi:predicted DNA-binding protein (UPF0251 family)
MKRDNIPETKKHIEKETIYIQPPTKDIPTGNKKLDNIDLEELKNLCLLGLTIEELAKFYGVHRDTFHRKMASSPEVYDIIQNYRKISSAKVAGALYKKAIGYQSKETFAHGYKGNIITKEIDKTIEPSDKAALAILRAYRPNDWQQPEKQDITISGNLQAYQTSQKLDNLDQSDLENLLNAANKLKQNKNND